MAPPDEKQPPSAEPEEYPGQAEFKRQLAEAAAAEGDAPAGPAVVPAGRPWREGDEKLPLLEDDWMKRPPSERDDE
jgi:hypothetical protein